MAVRSAEVDKSRASVARRSQSYPPDHPKVIEAKRDLAEAKIAAYVAKVLSEAPELTDGQRSRLAELLKPVRVGGAA